MAACGPRAAERECPVRDFPAAPKQSALHAQALHQKFELHKGRDRQVVEATFDVKSGVTTIKRSGHDSSRVTMPGLVLLRMTTSHGELKIEY